MNLNDLLTGAMDVINMMGLMPVIQAVAVAGISIMLYKKFFGSRGD